MNSSKRLLSVFFLIGLAVILLFPFVRSTFAACFNATSLAAIGNTTLSAACTVAADTSEVNDYTASENSTNAAVTTLTAAVTVNSGVVGTTVLGSGSFSIGTGGSIAVGSTNVTIKPGYPVWLADVDVDGWALNWTFATATISGKRRLGLMRSASTLDCSDAAYSEANSCYSYGQAWYYAYGYGQGMGYWSYAYGYSTCFPKDTEVLMADGTPRNIQEIRPGDKLMSYDQNTKSTTVVTVENLILHSVPSGYLILNNTFRINAGYPTWVANKQAWLQAGDIDTGDVLLGPAGEHMTITSMEKIEGTYIGYHLSFVEEDQNNFFAGGFLVRLK